MDAFTPQQTVELVSRIGCKKAHMRLDKLFFNSFMAGPLLGFGCAIALSTEAAPWFQANAPGLIRTIGALFFPIGLVMIVLSGADLFTSNVMFMTTALLHRRISVIDVLINWVVSFLGNLAGMLFFVAIITGYGGVFDMAVYRTETINFATMKIVNPQWHQVFLRGIGGETLSKNSWIACRFLIFLLHAANWLVCFAVFISISSREVVSKIIAIWLPTMTFVALALDHVIANMFFIPIGIWNGAPGITVGLYIWKSMIPAVIGNTVGGGIFVAAVYWYLYLTGESSVEMDFNVGGLNTAMEVGGPMGRKRSGHHLSMKYAERNRNVIHGEDPGRLSDASQLPNSSGHMVSGIGRELCADMYAKRKGEANEEKSAGV